MKKADRKAREAGAQSRRDWKKRTLCILLWILSAGISSHKIKCFSDSRFCLSTL